MAAAGMKSVPPPSKKPSPAKMSVPAKELASPRKLDQSSKLGRSSPIVLIDLTQYDADMSLSALDDHESNKRTHAAFIDSDADYEPPKQPMKTKHIHKIKKNNPIHKLVRRTHIKFIDLDPDDKPFCSSKHIAKSKTSAATTEGSTSYTTPLAGETPVPGFQEKCLALDAAPPPHCNAIPDDTAPLGQLGVPGDQEEFSTSDPASSIITRTTKYEHNYQSSGTQTSWNGPDLALRKTPPMSALIPSVMDWTAPSQDVFTNFPANWTENSCDELLTTIDDETFEAMLGFFDRTHEPEPLFYVSPSQLKRAWSPANGEEDEGIWDCVEFDAQTNSELCN